jgi:hypothetical protein
VDDDQVPVERPADVALDRRDPILQRPPERGECVLRRVAGCTAMADPKRPACPDEPMSSSSAARRHRPQTPIAHRCSRAANVLRCPVGETPSLVIELWVKFSSA